MYFRMISSQTEVDSSYKFYLIYIYRECVKQVRAFLGASSGSISASTESSILAQKLVKLEKSSLISLITPGISKLSDDASHHYRQIQSHGKRK